MFYEAQRKFRLAQKCYGKAMAADQRYEPAQLNMRSHTATESYGQPRGAALGDEAAEVLEFQRPEPQC